MAEPTGENPIENPIAQNQEVNPAVLEQNNSAVSAPEHDVPPENPEIVQEQIESLVNEISDNEPVTQEVMPLTENLQEQDADNKVNVLQPARKKSRPRDPSWA